MCSKIKTIMTKNNKNKILVFSTLFLSLIILIEIFILSDSSKKASYTSQISPKNIQAMASTIVNSCELSEYKPTCYEKEIPLLMSNGISMEDAFIVTKDVQRIDQSYAYCHVLGHKLSAEETKKNPDNWKDVITRCPSGVCSNGCIHGAFQERFRAESLPPEEIELLKPELAMVCEPRGEFRPTGLEKGTCYHALGHLSMYITEADISASINLCNELAVNYTSDYRHVCYDGVFMQIFQPLEQEDFSLIADIQITRETLNSFCDQFEGTTKGSCWTEGWPLFYPEVAKDPKVLTEFCNYLTYDESEYDRCFLSLTYVMTAQNEFDEVKISDFCEGLTGKYISECYGHAASRMIETDWDNIDKAIHLCREAESLGNGRACWEEMVVYASYNFHKGSSQHLDTCNKLPHEYKIKCIG
jgi:hypothetical protein